MRQQRVDCLSIPTMGSSTTLMSRIQDVADGTQGKGVEKMLRPVRTYGRYGNLFCIFQGIAFLHCGQLKARFTPSQLDMIKPGPGLSAHPRLARISAGLNDRSSLIKLLECEDGDASLGQSRSLLLLFWEPKCER
ncbi:hypothetical protein FALCPG4_014110 [Fusarium falciforme]